VTIDLKCAITNWFL